MLITEKAPKNMFLIYNLFKYFSIHFWEACSLLLDNQRFVEIIFQIKSDVFVKIYTDRFEQCR